MEVGHYHLSTYQSLETAIKTAEHTLKETINQQSSTATSAISLLKLQRKLVAGSGFFSKLSEKRKISQEIKQWKALDKKIRQSKNTSKISLFNIKKNQTKLEKLLSNPENPLDKMEHGHVNEAFKKGQESLQAATNAILEIKEYFQQLGSSPEIKIAPENKKTLSLINKKISKSQAKDLSKTTMQKLQHVTHAIRPAVQKKDQMLIQQLTSNLSKIHSAIENDDITFSTNRGISKEYNRALANLLTQYQELPKDLTKQSSKEIKQFMSTTGENLHERMRINIKTMHKEVKKQARTNPELAEVLKALDRLLL